ncbi:MULTISPECIES: 50S ribosomal protein L4 [unclassified Thermosynechococcus]|uniref:50S ribosomal protein L4 n=1 Tax=unclassified Thermosynechococcus TaxID=2622553 RepID=UPI00267271A1|nr:MULTISPECIES: 50S ribosomal protein L4 [unclassified Thermosynechococcus]MDR5639479.1 50S ribosomal protein L4 [Thermosynechococcus sp. PP42]MDR7898568.1 50S ribosomal protein L4 [Thermosynechococcus sp. JY1332]MDR7905972.1 50S ribosomal protein L4 [Thermosynechococcus sp. JY1334]MDR7921847.1 50S ribosomal protein L4 [Thermosynechococcus sp. HY213]MDR7993791.1 50S ribosomal protein L4 [Thermosynechococcus sp. TG252]
MVACVVKDWQGADSGEATLDLTTAKPETASHIVHRALVRQLANARQGTVSTKTRAEVRGGGRKPWRQKGTGRARAGSIRSPLWRGGGVIFGPKPRDYSQKMNRKERRLALRTALMSRVEDLIVVQDFADHLPRPKTKELVTALQRWGIEPEQKVLLLVEDIAEMVALSARNVPTLKLLRADQLNVFDLLYADRIVATTGAIAKIQEVYGD